MTLRGALLVGGTISVVACQALLNSNEVVHIHDDAALEDATADTPTILDDSTIVDVATLPDAASPCDESGAWLCEDFDHPPLSVQWERRVTPEGFAGRITTDDVAATSSPLSLLAETATVTAVGDPARARLCRTFAAVPTSMTLDVDMRVDDAPLGNRANLLSLRLMDVDESHGVYVDLFAAGPSAWDFAAYDATQTPPYLGLMTHPPLHDWDHVKLDVSYENDGDGGVSGTGHLSLHRLATPLATQTFSAAFTPAQVQLCLGVIYLELPSDPWRLRYDNLILDLTK